MPGVKQCVVCSAALSAESSAQDVMPPRARDRTLRQRLRYTLESGGLMPRRPAGGAAANDSAQAGWKRFAPRLIRRVPFSLSFGGSLGWLNLRNLGQLLIAAIPGFGHWFVLGRPAVGKVIFLSCTAALLLAALFYRSELSNILVYGVQLASAVSVYSVMSHLVSIGAPRLSRARLAIGTGLLVAALYLGAYHGVILALSPFMQPVRVLQGAQGSIVGAGDTALLWRRGDISRGDVIVAWVSYNGDFQNIGVVLGVPGDLVTISDRLYINEMPVAVELPMLRDGDNKRYWYSASNRVDYVLKPDEYWIVPDLNPALDIETLLREGTVRRDGIEGRIVAVINPPARRGLVSTASNRER